MKNTKKILTGAMLIILLCLSIIVGSTFALFTSESKNNIAITSGKVDVVSNLSNLKTYTNNELQSDGTFALGGSAKIIDGSLELNHIAPMDKAEFDIELQNNSTISIRYQLQLIANDELSKQLFNSLNIKASIKNNDLELIKNGLTIVSKWSDTKLKETKLDSIHLSIELPIEVTNELEEQSCSLTIVIYAVQANAHVEEPVKQEDNNEVYLYNASDLKEFRDSINIDGTSYKGKTVYLMNDINLNNEEWEPIGINGINENHFDGTFDGKSFTISNLNVTRTNELYGGLFGSTQNGKFKNINFIGAEITSKYYAGVLGGNLYTSSIDNVHVEKATIHTSHWLGGIVGSIYGNITNSSVKDIIGICTPDKADGRSYDNGDKVGGIVGQLQDSGQYHIDNCVVENVELTAYRDLGGLAGCGTGSAKFYQNNILKNVTLTIDRTNYYGDKDYNVNSIVGRSDNPNHDTFKNNEEDVNIKYVNCRFMKTSDGNYVVTTPKSFVEFATQVNTGKDFVKETVVLLSDIDLTGIDWTPIGYNNKHFHGTFDGMNHIISNLNINKETGSIGLFGSVYSGGDGPRVTIKNFTVENVTVKGGKNKTDYVGSVVGIATPLTIENVNLKGLVKIDSQNGWAGGLVGYCQTTTFNNCHIDVTNESYVKTISATNTGGITSFGDYNVSFNHITTNLNVIGVSNVGGILGAEGGDNPNTKFTDCHVNSNITGDSGWIGGITGRVMKNTTLENVTFNGKLSNTKLSLLTKSYSGLFGNVYNGTPTILSSNANTSYDGNMKILTEYNESGKATTTYEIYTPKGLVDLGEAINKGYIVKGEGRSIMIFLKEDLDMTEIKEFSPINGQWISFNGEYHTISNINLGKDSTGKSGLFGYAGALELQNLTLENVTAKGSQVGTFAAHTLEIGSGFIKNVTLKGNVTLDYEKSNEEYGSVGVFVGVYSPNDGVYNNLIIDKDCKVTINLNGIITKLVNKTDYYLLGMGTTEEKPLNYVITNEVKDNTNITILNEVYVNEGTSLDEIIFTDGVTYYFSEGTFSPTSNEQLNIRSNNITLIGQGTSKTIIDTKEFSCADQAGVLFGGNNVTIKNMTFKTTSQNNNVSAIKFSAIDHAEEIVQEGYLENVNVIGSLGHGINLHGVKNFTLKNIEISGYHKCGISLAKAENVHLTSIKTLETTQGWGDIGMMYKDDEGVSYNAPCSVIIDGTNSFGKNAAYSERKDTATGGLDTLNGKTGTKGLLYYTWDLN